MAQLLVRNIDDAVSKRLAERARLEGKTSEELAREIITRNVDQSRDQLSKALDEIRVSTVGKKVIDPVKAIRRDRDRDHAG